MSNAQVERSSNPVGAPDTAHSACRNCGAPLRETFADLGMSPLANAFITQGRRDQMEPFYPLHALVCSQCLLVQLAEFESAETIFGDYLYFSSYSESWLRHAERYAEAMTQRFALGSDTLVVEVASNDGYLLQFFQRAGVPVLGVDPAANVAHAAVDLGIPTEIAFFNADTALRLRADGHTASLMTANNVLAHVPDLHPFVEGFRILLSPGGVATFEFPHLLRLIELRQFDTIYHEHFSYFSLLVVEQLFARHELTVFDVQELPTHGGSLRVFARHAANDALPVLPTVAALREAEYVAGLGRLDTYTRFSETIVECKLDLLEFLIGARRHGERVVGYGAPAKGNTLLNYCGVGPELLPFIVDVSPYKQGLLLPGTRIPIHPPEALFAARPDWILILPWNLQDEITTQLAAARDWGGRFVVPIPRVRVL